jgi:hypothetical protein
LSVLPEIDLNKFKKNEYYGGPAAATIFHELQLQNSISIPIASRWDSQFHRHYAKAIERTYYGKLDFLFRFNSPDYEVFNSFHNAYYESIGVNFFEGSRTDTCEQILQKNLTSEASPLAEWLQTPADHFLECPTYEIVGKYLKNNSRLSLGDDANRQTGGAALSAYVLTLANGNSLHLERKQSPFIFFKRFQGGEGSTPTLEILPSISILPQYQINPQPEVPKIENTNR